MVYEWMKELRSTLFREANYEHPRWLALQFLSNNEVVEKEMKALPIYKELITIRSRLEENLIVRWKSTFTKLVKRILKS